MKQAFSTFFNRFFSRRTIQNFSERDTPVKKIEITVTCFVPEPVPVTTAFASAFEAIAWLDLATETDCLIEAFAWQGKSSLGDFCLWCSSDFACARIEEHRAHNARYLDSAFVAPDTVAFKDDDGSLYVPRGELILPRQLAIDALHAWLIDQKHPPMLRWD